MASTAKNVHVKNVSEETQVFTGHPPFAVGEVREVSAEEGEILARSPFMRVAEKPSKMKGNEPENKKNMKGIETE